MSGNSAVQNTVKKLAEVSYDAVSGLLLLIQIADTRNRFFVVKTEFLFFKVTMFCSPELAEQRQVDVELGN